MPGIHQRPSPGHLRPGAMPPDHGGEYGTTPMPELVQRAKSALPGMAILAHDIRNLISTARLAAEEIEERAGDPRVTTLAARIAGAIDLVANLCEATANRDPSKPSGSGPRHDVQDGTVDVQALVREVVERLTADVRPAVRTDITIDGCPSVRVSGSHLFRILFNLIQNALHAVERSGGSWIEIGIEAERELLIVDIRDDGPGLPPSVVRRFFPGFGGDRDRSGVVTLGLSSVFALAHELGGRLLLMSTGASGTHFRLLVPIEPAARPAPHGLDMAPEDLERVFYFERFVVTEPGLTPLKLHQLLTEEDYVSAQDEFGGEAFTAQTGVDAVNHLLATVDLENGRTSPHPAILATDAEAQRGRLTARLKPVETSPAPGANREWTILDIVPELWPVVRSGRGQLAPFDHDDPYRRMVTRYARLRRLTDLRAPEIIRRNEKRMLRADVSALLGNGQPGQTDIPRRQ